MGKAARNRERSARERIAAQQAAARKAEARRRLLLVGGAVIVVAAIVIAIVVTKTSSGSSTPSTSHQVIPPGVSGTTTTEPKATKIANSTGINGVVAYVTTGWPQSSNNGPQSEALRHNHVPGPVIYSVTPPVGGDHNAIWMNCGVYSKPVPNERAVHNMEHGAVWITYQPNLPAGQVNALRAFVMKQSVIEPNGAPASRYMDLTPYPGLPSPIVISAWGFQLRVTSPSDPRLQEFVNKFRATATYTPEFGGQCTGGVGRPLEK